MVRTWVKGIVKISGVDGYLNEGEGPFGCKNVTLIYSVSGIVFKTHANHHPFSYFTVTKPLMSCNSICFFLYISLTILFPLFLVEIGLTSISVFEIRTKL